METMTQQQLEVMNLGWKPEKRDIDWTKEQLRRWSNKVSVPFNWVMTGGVVSLNIPARTVEVLAYDVNDPLTIPRVLLVLSKLGWTINKSKEMDVNLVKGKPMFDVPSNVGGYDKFHS